MHTDKEFSQQLSDKGLIKIVAFLAFGQHAQKQSFQLGLLLQGQMNHSRLQKRRLLQNGPVLSGKELR
ncbi:hypothetical protein D3C71_2174410 [compost metagenome]